MVCNRIYALLFLFILILISVSSCINKNKKDTSGIKDKIKYRQYMVLGRKLYNDNCANCHQEDGSGLRRLYPPLLNSDFFDNDIPDILCLIRYGRKKGISVNGTNFEQEMPDNSQLTNLDIAAVSTYVLSTFGSKAVLVSPEEIGNLEGNCEIE